MESRLRVAGHPIHPILVMFPLGLFAMAVIFDVAHLAGAPAMLGAVAYWTVAAGLIGGVLAALAGAVDLMFIPNGTAAKRAGVMHGLINMGVLLLFAVILMLRMASHDRVAGGGLLTVELLALAGAFVGAWYGGELVNRLSAPTAFAQPAAGHRTF
ncbi:MAG TPA: DUF2231 domain-containing protein [Actinoplanes sp.]|jgi:uncharacterized membrane protein